ncbi:MAG: FlgD immunoglobulin-like domain containing protein [Candidatus Eisenbacteria bacterium]
MKSRSPVLAVLLAALLAFAAWADPPPAEKETRSGERIPSSVMSAGGRAGGSANYALQGTLGQPTPPGIGASNNYILSAGFWRKASVATRVLEELLPPVFRNALYPNVPNPFNPVTTLRYEVEGTAPVEIGVFDVRGRLVRTLVNETMGPGRHEAVWDGRTDSGESAPSGVYLYRIRIGSFGDVRKMVLVK